jgi:hypothetical protein
MHLARLGEPSEMGVAGGQKTIWRPVGRHLLNCGARFRQRQLKATSEEMGDADGTKQDRHIGARVEPHRFFEMLDGGIEVARINAQDAARSPGSRIARVEVEGTLDKVDRSSDILAEIAQGKARAAENAWIVGLRFNGPAGQRDRLGLVACGIIGRTGSIPPAMGCWPSF